MNFQKGATTAHVRVGDGVIITSSITKEAVHELGIAVGQVVPAVIKASDVMIGLRDVLRLGWRTAPLTGGLGVLPTGPYSA